ncbi:MAG: sulfite exporter TauE/SafE family protein [Phycisphaerales bacterium]|nr:MAG: sulfite exporter TauE/SafE family protein [Phycisphaerales bacterium]
MPELFGDIPSFVACVLIMAAAQVIYATVGFGAGMFAVSLMALVLPNLTGVVVVLLILTFVTEVWVLAHNWHHARIRLLGWLLPGMAVGLWTGTWILETSDVSFLKRLLGLVVIGAGVYFILESRNRRHNQNAASGKAQLAQKTPWLTLPLGLISGVLGAMFGTGGPPVIILLRAYGLDKAAFRSTILTYFLLMSLLRAGTYTNAGFITVDYALAAGMLLPSSLVGIIIGMIVHNRISESRFSQLVSVLLVALGILLATGAGK